MTVTCEYTGSSAHKEFSWAIQPRSAKIEQCGNQALPTALSSIAQLYRVRALVPSALAASTCRTRLHARLPGAGPARGKLVAARSTLHCNAQNYRALCSTGMLPCVSYMGLWTHLAMSSKVSGETKLTRDREPTFNAQTRRK